MSYIPQQTLTTTAFGETTTAQPTPVAQIMAPYGLLQKADSFVLNGGTTGANDSLFECTTGTNASALSAVLTRRQVTYRPGQGLLARLTAVFDTVRVNNIQQAGLIINTDRFVFGYNSSGVFGISRYHDGESEIRELTVNTPAAGAEVATVVVDGIGYPAALTAGTVQHNAYEIANALNAVVPEYNFSSNDNQVVARSLLQGNGGAFAFTSSTATASWAQVQAGLAPQIQFIPQTSWNQNTFPTLNPQNGNVYQVQAQYLGFGAIKFFIEDTNSGDLVEVHRIQYANTATTPTVGNPTFRVGWLTQNSGNTTSVTLKGASAAGFIEGYSVRSEAPRALEYTNASVGTASFTNIITFRNRLVLGKKRNRAEVFGLSLSAATDSTKGIIVKVLVGAQITGDLVYNYVDKANSVIEYANDAGTVTSGRLIYSFVVPPNGGQIVNLEELSAVLLPDTPVTICARVIGGAASSVTATVVWQEDL